MTDAAPPAPPETEPVALPPEEAAPSGAGTAPLLARIGGLKVQALVAVGLKAGAAAAALLLQWLIARIYGPEGTGLFALMATTVTFIGVVAVAGQDYISLRNVAGDLAEAKPGEARAHARASVRIAMVSTVLGTLAVGGVALAYGFGLQPAMMPILLLAAPVVAGLSLGRVFSFVARAGGRIISSQLPDGPITSAVSVSLLLIAFLAWGTPPSWTLGAVYGIAYIAALGFAFGLYRRVTAPWPGDGMAKPLRPILVAGLPMVLASASPYFSDWAVIFTATAAFGPEVAGQVRIVMLFLSVMYLIFVAFDSVVAPPMASALRLHDMPRFHRIYWQYALGSFAFNLPLISAALIFPAQILGLFGPEFAPAASALRWAVLLQSLTIILGPAGLVLLMSKRERQVIWVNVVGLLVLVPGCALLIPEYGVTGGALVAASVLLGKRLTEVVLVRRGPWRHGQLSG